MSSYFHSSSFLADYNSDPIVISNSTANNTRRGGWLTLRYRRHFCSHICRRHHLLCLPSYPPCRVRLTIPCHFHCFHRQPPPPPPPPYTLSTPHPWILLLPIYPLNPLSSPSPPFPIVKIAKEEQGECISRNARETFPQLCVSTRNVMAWRGA